MVIAIDMGGTNIRIAQVKGLKITKKKIIPTPSKKDEILNSLYSLIKGYSDKKTICVSIAGFVKNNKIYLTPNLDLNDFDLRKWINEKFKSKVYIENDAKCAALSEIKYGFGKKFSNFIVLTIGTGIGGAIIINHKLYRGAGFAGEFGHMLLDGDEFEKIASGTALNKLANDLNLNIGGKEIAKRAQNSDPISKKVFDIIIENLSTGLLNVIHALDPEAIIIGGGFSNINFLATKLSICLKDKDLIERNISVMNSKLGEDAELIGASLLAKAS